jgi:hypothetical protein
MSLRPLPDLTNSEVMAKLGRASALRNARLDAIHAMRDAVVRLQNAASFDSVELPIIKACVERLEQLSELDNREHP